MAKPRPADVFLFSCPRTLSNLLVKLLSGQPGWDESTYFLHEAFEHGLQYLGDENAKPLKERREEYVQKMSAGYATMLAARDQAAAKGHAILFKSHITQVLNPSFVFRSVKDDTQIESLFSASGAPRTNPTVFTDEMLLSFTPLFLIRHPALGVDSFYRAKARDDLAGFDVSHRPYAQGLHAIRSLFEWYEAAGNQAGGSESCPIVIDADDLLEGDTVARLARTLGMDADKIPQSWEARSTEGLDPRKKIFVGNLWSSTGIDKSKTSKGLDVAALERSWDRLYGREVGRILSGLANGYMDDYLWLKSRKF